ncbi:MAG: hypothetical protein WKI04_17490 [Ferruginibacter sp.]
MKINFGYKKLYIGGTLCEAADNRKHEVLCPATEKGIAEIAWATKADTEKALKVREKVLSTGAIYL